MNAFDSLRHFLPEIFILAAAFLSLAVDLVTKQKRIVGFLALFSLIGYVLLTHQRVPAQTLYLFYHAFSIDHLTSFAGHLIPLATLITILISFRYRHLPRLYEGEYYTLFLFMTFALIMMAASVNLLMIYLSIEFVSLLSYLMVGLLKKDARSKEAAVKYLLFGSAASAVMLYGMSLLYGLSGSIDLFTIYPTLINPGYTSITSLAMIFFMVGLGFKISMAPFHMWAPDVYEAAPTPVTAFLTVAPKAAGFLVLIRVLGVCFAALQAEWQSVIIVLSILTMTIGNLTAILQTNIKRLLAYSSIAQAGYLLMGIAVFGLLGLRSLLIYLVVYTLTNLGAFSVVLAVENQSDKNDLSVYAGLAKRSPILALSLTLFLLSLAGLPPLAGFIGKFFLFASVIQSKIFILAIAAALNSAIAAYYYFRIVRTMYLENAADSNPIPLPLSLKTALIFCLAGVLFLGLLPVPLLVFIQNIIS